ncbi:hypothetical protein UFOVP264_17 [uncultured Caudovirales phage]|uniref:Uncharacterized protein n=1 Tax=uncultured Caudovirales phage TaxID=2100421 RepID=A0A6J5LGF7_9CAUD|nr:hypothetical protein UFOVP264_17 [uncultured Caudovirales phage]
MAKEGINRTIDIAQPSIFGRIGTGLGKGIAETLPREIERGRLASGLNKLGNQKNLTPFQAFAGLAATPGITPQMLQSGSDILRQQQYLNALKNQYEAQGGPQSAKQVGYTPTPEEVAQPRKGEIPTLATPEATAESYKIFILPTEQEERQNAFANFQANPARYNYNFDDALAEQKAITARNEKIQQSYQGQEATAVNKEEKVKEALADEVKKLKLNNIPPKAYQKFEEKILNSVLSKKEGGEGLTQEQAIKKYSKDLDQANRNYLDLSSLSSWSPLDFNRRVNSLQKDFASRGEQQQMMDQLVSDYELSPLYAAHKAYPIEKGAIPTINKLKNQISTSAAPGAVVSRLNDPTYEQLKKEMGKKNSPLSIAYELQSMNQDPRGFLNYLNNHRDDLEVWQADQLTKNLNIFDLKDIWLRAWE